MTRMIINDMRRNLRDASYWIFVVLMPIGFYLAFGGFTAYAREPIPNSGANVSGYILVQMAFYSACLAAVTVGAQTGGQRASGWYRTLSLTPMTDGAYTVARLCVTAFTSLFAVTVLYLVALSSFATMTVADWFITYGLCIALSIPFSMVGQVCATSFAPSTASSVSAGVIVLAAMASDLFMPLSGALLTVARFMPLFGAKTLVLWPIAEGVTASQVHIPMWQAAANFVVWATLFIVMATLGMRAAKQRG